MKVVQKYGGTSVANIDRIRHVASLIAAEKARGNHVVAVVSAMAGHTNTLQGWISELVDPVSENPDIDPVLSSGEQVTSGLMALALQEKGLKAQSLQGWQLPLFTNKRFGTAQIQEIETAIVDNMLGNDIIPVIAGFQGITADRRITTLGRGGSDTSAVALAIALGADQCDIYTDVEGIYTADPRICPRARLLKRISFEEMLELSARGAKVLHPRAVELARRYQMRLSVRSSFLNQPGTLIVQRKELPDMESQIITGLSVSTDEAKVTINNMKDTPGTAARVFGALSEAEINVDMIVQNIPQSADQASLTFTLPMAVADKAEQCIQALEGELEYDDLIVARDVAKVSAIGQGMLTQTGVAHKMFDTLSHNEINIQAISTSEIRISVLIQENNVDKAMKALHTAFELDK